MSIVIQGMEMPATCWNCKLKVGFSACGLVTDHKDGGFFYRVHNGNSRPDWCPLVPLPEGHGRLGDLDKLDYAFTALRFNEDGSLKHWDDRKNWCLHGSEIETLLANAPTIVPAEGGGENG